MLIAAAVAAAVSTLGLRFSDACVRPCETTSDCASSRGETSTSSTGPAGGATGELYDQYAFFESPSGTYVSTIITPTFSISTDAYVEFYYHAYGANIGSMVVEAVTPSANLTLLTVVGQQHTDQSSNWTREGLALPNATTRVKWVMTSNGARSDYGLDNVTVYEGLNPITQSPTAPTAAPTPSAAPTPLTASPSESPTAVPTSPTAVPTIAPTTATNSPTSAPTVPPGTVFSCLFDTVCGMTATSRWRLKTGSTPSSSTGPNSGDSGLSSDQYIFTEMSNGGTFGEISSLTTPALSLPSGGYVSFSYHMFGSRMGNMFVEAADSSMTYTLLWAVYGQQHSSSGAAWSQAFLALPANTVSIRWNVTYDGSFRGDAALDSITVVGGQTAPPTAPTGSPAAVPTIAPTAASQPPTSNPTKAPTAPTPAPTITPTRGAIFACDFIAEDDYYCGMDYSETWNLVTNGPIDPNRFNGKSKTRRRVRRDDTGPCAGDLGGHDNYVYAQMSAGQTTDPTPNITTPLFTALSATGYVSFVYFFTADDAANNGSLAVFARDSGGVFTQIWSVAGPQQDQIIAPWKEASAVLPSGTTAVRWVATPGHPDDSTIALDTITVKLGSAPSPAAPPPPPPGVLFECSFDTGDYFFCGMTIENSRAGYGWTVSVDYYCSRTDSPDDDYPVYYDDYDLSGRRGYCRPCRLCNNASDPGCADFCHMTAAARVFGDDDDNATSANDDGASGGNEDQSNSQSTGVANSGLDIIPFVAVIVGSALVVGAIGFAIASKRAARNAGRTSPHADGPVEGEHTVFEAPAFHQFS